MAYPTEAPRQTHRSPSHTSEVAPADEIRTIMLNQVAWGAVFAGAVIGLVMQIILSMVGLGVGLSTMDIAQSDVPNAGSISVGAGIWFVVSGIVAAALGGYIAGRLSGKASQSTTAYHGLISWAVSTLTVVYLLSSAASGAIGGAVSTASSALGGAGKALGGTVQTAVQAAAPSLNNVANNAADPMAAIESKVRSASGGQDPAALRDAAMTAVRAALNGDPAQQAAANDKAADALAKAQNISQEEAKNQIAQYQQQYKETVAKTKEQAKQAADLAAKRASQGALFGALALLLGALAAFFGGRASAVTPTVSVRTI
ncbi:PhnA-like protein [Bradyrhizobium yuanmingense]|uniref:PhnA-like protein n=1 Tax=Bradyrhizobium yuanmingense TaxID=108015 RepID=UPI0023BA3701|nr:PhnA-like protein [Bradyrhizobium yuanmingense]MDF0496389.1 PhnA-like protein [Bradyrhizobium yuanmingense]